MIKREKYLYQIKNAFEFIPIVVLIGSRQVGKTTLMNIFKTDKKHVTVDGQNIEEAVLFEKYSIWSYAPGCIGQKPQRQNFTYR